jgi:hypothetical protein
VLVLAVAERSDAIPWLIAAGIVLGAWLVLFSVVATATMPRLPDPGPATTELGPESPAIANMLVNRCKVTTSAMSATLVDLAARRHVSIDQIGDRQNLVRLRRQGRDGLNAYEKEVLEIAQSKATNDTAPAMELSLGYGKDADRWWKVFQKSVAEHARDLGLVRRRFNLAHKLLLTITLAIPFAIAGVGLEFFGEAQRAAGEDMDAGGGFGIAGFVFLIVLAVGAARLRGWRETAKGEAACAHWLGVREYLGQDEAFRDTPPAGVAIWDRLLSYGVALGVAHGTDAALPIGPTRDDEGWSPQRGLWRQVEITYPRRFGYGESPKRAIVFSLLVLAGVSVLGVIVVRNFVPMLSDVVGDIVDDDNGQGRWLLLPILAILSIPLAFVIVQIVRRVVMLIRAFPDLGQTSTFEGYVVRIPWHYVRRGDNTVWAPKGYTAVDDGHNDEVRALRYYSAELREGQTVRVTMTPRMRHVISMEPVH